MSRHLAIGDIHGCYEALRTLWDFVGFREDDTIITLGDYSGKGPDTLAVIDWLSRINRTHKLIPLRGNHDIMMLNARMSAAKYRKWINLGGDMTLRSYNPISRKIGKLTDIPESHWDFLDNHLQPFFETDTHFFVHANASPGLPLHKQPDLKLYQKKFKNPSPHESGKIMVCGHTAQKSGVPVTNGHAICLDTFAHGRGWLSCLHIESGIIYQANQYGQTRQLRLNELEINNSV
ncbi:MAG: serine/threonine protein phosphatase [Desulfobulbaceae bacterium]|nr:serine/threonine protein phosphatase [Desulfobulbaceae bacterium]